MTELFWLNNEQYNTIKPLLPHNSVALACRFGLSLWPVALACRFGPFW